MSEKKTANPIIPDPRTDEEWAAIQHTCRSDPNYVHPKEKEALERLKSQFPDVALHPFWNRYPKDKALYAFLFQRKLDVARTADVLKEHLEVKFSQLDQKLIESAFSYHTPGKRDKQGRLICYIFMGRFKPKEYAKGCMARIQIWTFEHLLKTESLDAWRFGFTYVEDLTGAGLSNVQNDKAEQKQMMAMLEIFPFRIRRVHHSHIPEDCQILCQKEDSPAGKRTWKILVQVECVKKADLLDRIDADSLITEFGGNHKFDYHAWLEKLRQEESKHETATETPEGVSGSSGSGPSSSSSSSGLLVTIMVADDIDADDESVSTQSSARPVRG